MHTAIRGGEVERQVQARQQDGLRHQSVAGHGLGAAPDAAERLRSERLGTLSGHGAHQRLPIKGKYTFYANEPYIYIIHVLLAFHIDKMEYLICFIGMYI